MCWWEYWPEIPCWKLAWLPAILPNPLVACSWPGLPCSMACSRRTRQKYSLLVFWNNLFPSFSFYFLTFCLEPGWKLLLKFKFSLESWTVSYPAVVYKVIFLYSLTKQWWDEKEIKTKTGMLYNTTWAWCLLLKALQYKLLIIWTKKRRNHIRPVKTMYAFIIISFPSFVIPSLLPSQYNMLFAVSLVC